MRCISSSKWSQNAQVRPIRPGFTHACAASEAISLLDDRVEARGEVLRELLKHALEHIAPELEVVRVVAAQSRLEGGRLQQRET